MKSRFILFNLILFSYFNCYSQKEIIPDIQKLQGNWVFVDGDFYDYLLFKKNKKIEISYFSDSHKAMIDESTFGYFGFWNPETHGDEEPKHLSQLEKSGVFIRFYDDLGVTYDSNGNLQSPTRQCGLSINEDSEDTIPNILRFYYKGTPDVYTKITHIPLEVILGLKKNVKEWEKYKKFMSIEELKVNVIRSKIYALPNFNAQTNMYLVKDNSVEILARSGSFTKIRFYGKKIIEGWIETNQLNR
ncbi:hypothetical protein [Pedobacter paludis]|uniref:Uncharacterized protein n=1 Tax=Pedobacter paludis TaxID=2203212 RepID=A0A317F3W5_9SPHI|nr:hypothetical protein [Pedobacter paludis]PWS33860.1 hypothetical protein DF947_04420 [Pedobacter paludis]